jgi:hypothetical protein
MYGKIALPVDDENIFNRRSRKLPREGSRVVLIEATIWLLELVNKIGTDVKCNFLCLYFSE